jgi:toxin ParE1/3/4
VGVEFTPEAQEDLLDIAQHIAQSDPVAADRWIDKLVQRARNAARLPRAGRIVPEIGRPDVREVFLRTYRVIYRIESKGIVVLNIIEGHRLLRR